MDLDSNFMFPFETACVLERMDENTRVVKGWLNPRGLAGALCAPREVSSPPPPDPPARTQYSKSLQL